MSARAIVVSGSVQRETKWEAETKNNPTEQTVANLAYDLWQKRGCPEDSPERDWTEAEELVRGRRP
jgi:hypothetical protein